MPDEHPQQHASDIEYIQDLLGPLHPSQIGEIEVALGESRDGVIRLAEKIAAADGLVSPPAVFSSSVRKCEYRPPRRQRMSTGNPAPQRCTPAEAFRRLYDAKAADLAQYEIPVEQRRVFALDFAAGEVWRCNTTPMPQGGVIRLEQELCAELGIDRFTGKRTGRS